MDNDSESDIFFGEGSAPAPDEASHALSRRERRRIETRERLFEAAIALFSERDFDAVTVEMITEAADVGKGTFFNYFANKEALIAYYFETLYRFLAQSLQTQAEELQTMQACARHVATHDAQEDAIWDRMMAMILKLAEFDSRSRRFTRTLLALTQTNEAVRKENARIKKSLMETSVEVIRLEQALGAMRSDFPPQILACFIRNVYFSTLMDWAQSETEQNLQEMLRVNFALARDAVRPTRSSEERSCR